MYQHGFGVLFLSEAYGLNKRPEIRGTLEKAVRLIVDTQNNEGGLRYRPVRADADLSVTVCQFNALRHRSSCRPGCAGGDDRRLHWLRQTLPEFGRRLQVHAPGRGHAFPRSAGGLLCLMSSDGSDSKEVRDGVHYLRQHTREIRFGARDSHFFYGHYYAAQAMRLRGGDDWKEWYTAIRDELVRRQNPLGYWTDSIGNDYGTAMALIILQMPKSRLLLFRDKQDTK